MTKKLNNHELVLNVSDRLSVQRFISPQGSLETAIYGESIITKVKVSSEEADRIKLVENLDGTVNWDSKLEKDKKILFNDSEAKMLKKNMLIMGRGENIPKHLYSLAVKINDLKVKVELPTLPEEQQEKE